MFCQSIEILRTVQPTMPALRRRLASWLPLVQVIALAAQVRALDTSHLPTGANHSRAHAYADGVGVRIGIIETVAIGIFSDEYLGDRLKEQYDFRGLTPSQTPPLIADPDDVHETLVANVAAGNSATYPGVAPGAEIYDAGVNGTESIRAAFGWLDAQHQIDVYNLSFGFGANNNGANLQARFSDWFVQDKGAVVVHSSGNNFGQISLPGDSYNGITVGAMEEMGQSRRSSSSYRLNGGSGGTEVRGKPDILAPGEWVRDGISTEFGISGTSFAAPHVAGTAALMIQYARDELDLPLHHLANKAVILNSARKRSISLPEVHLPESYDSASGSASFDKDYLDTSTPVSAIANPATTGLTNAWTPSAWTYDGTRFSTSKPLDDEQGVGFLDTTRAVVQLAGGRQGPGSVSGIGWDQSTFAPGGNSVVGLYSLDQAVPAGGFVTATLAWDRVVLETDGDGIVEDDDTYSIFELADLNLRILDGNDQVVAQSISTTDNVEHLHVPVPTIGLPGSYKLEIHYAGGATLPTDYALAWWTSQQPSIPGDYDLDGVVDAADYGVWRDSYGASGASQPLFHGDGNANGLVDARDYIIWRDNLGSTLAGMTASDFANRTHIPEPSALALVALSLPTFLASCRVFVQVGRRELRGVAACGFAGRSGD